MKVFALLALLMAVPLFGCPRNVPETVAGSDDDMLDHYGAKHEELRARSRAPELDCEDRCKIALEGCELGRRICEVASRNENRVDMQRRCTEAQEECSSFNDGCARCRGS